MSPGTNQKVERTWYKYWRNLFTKLTRVSHSPRSPIYPVCLQQAFDVIIPRSAAIAELLEAILGALSNGRVGLPRSRVCVAPIGSGKVYAKGDERQIGGDHSNPHLTVQTSADRQNTNHRHCH